MASLRITLLGGFEARLGSGEAIDLHGRKTRALLAYLALPPGEPRSRDKLVALLWSDRGEQQARGSLRQALAELRKALGDADPPPLVAGRDAVHLDAGAVEVDAVELERLVADGAPEALERATELYQGDLLDGIGVHDPAFEEWLRTERERLHDRAREAMSSLLDHETSAGNTDQAVATARRLLSLDPLQESTHRALMKLYADQGDRAMALKQYQACREVLRAELGLKLDAETERLIDEIREGVSETDEAEKPASSPAAATEPLALPDKPSIAVLPFVNMSGDPEQEYFTDGITEDIITELSRFRSLFVIARNSSFTHKGQAINVTEVGKTLGVQYVVEGSVRKAGNRVRVTAQLVEAATGNHLWAERYDRELEDIFTVQDELVRTITATLGGRVDSAGQIRAERLSKTDLQAYDLVLRANAAWLRFNKEDNRHAREHLERAIDLDPRSAQAYLTLAMVHLLDWMAHWVVDRDEDLVAAFECAKRSVALDDTHSTAQTTLGMVHMLRREFYDARHHHERALVLNPNDSIALGYYGIYLTAIGHVDEAFTQFDQSARINPLQPDWVDWLRGITFFTARRYDEAIASLRTIKDPINEVRGWLAASYAGAGRLDEARATLEEFLRVAEEDMAVFPGRKIAAWEPYWHGALEYQNEADFEHLFTALRKAGLE